MKNKKKKLLFIFGTRPEAIKMIPVVMEFKKNSQRFAVCICVTAQHRQMLDQVLGLFLIRPQYDLDLMTKKQSLSRINASVLVSVTGIMLKEKPDLVFVQGDTTTTLAAAQAAFYLKIPVAHIEAGLRTHNKFSPFPEEINRRLTSVLSDLHFAPTLSAKENLIREGIDRSSIHVTGNTVIDALRLIQNRHLGSEASKKWVEWFLVNYNVILAKNARVILVTGHRRESFGSGFRNICKAISILAKNNPDVRFVYPVHLNPNVQRPVYSILGKLKNVQLLPPLEYEPFVFLMKMSTLILTDSGGIQEEAPALGVPVLVMRQTSERIEGIRSGSAVLVGTNINEIVKRTQILLDNKDDYEKISKVRNTYGDAKASKRIVKTVIEYFRRQI